MAGKWTVRGLAASGAAVILASTATALGTAGTACACSCVPPRAVPNPVVVEGTVQSSRDHPKEGHDSDRVVYTIAVTRVLGDTGAAAPRTLTVGLPDRAGSACGMGLRDGESVQLLVKRSTSGAAEWSTNLCTNLSITKIDLRRLPVSVPA